MAEIKSALQIAMEKTQNIKGDPESVTAHEFKVKGRQLASEYLAEEEVDVKKRLKGFSSRETVWVREGFFNSLMANLTLPSDETAVERLPKITAGLAAVMKDHGVLNQAKTQLTQFFTQYLADRKQLDEALRQQLAPRLRQRQQELSRQMGRPVQVDPASDPEFAQAMRQHLGRLEEQYQGVLDQLKEQLTSIFQSGNR